VQLDAERIEYRINGEPMATVKPIRAVLGETQIWTIANQTSWSHPFHLHGFFRRLDDNGEPVRPLVWKDTINIPFNETVRVIVRFDDRPGSWMVHCHILDHAEGGLMTTGELGTPSSSTRAPMHRVRTSGSGPTLNKFLHRLIEPPWREWASSSVPSRAWASKRATGRDRHR
jgi:multicopper oxidase